jgi:hypothetical protein
MKCRMSFSSLSARGPSLGTAGTFSFTKWYLDCVDADGRSVILYWAALAWRGLALTWHSVLLHEPGRQAVQRTSLVRVAAPRRRPGAIAWRAPALGCMVSASPRQESFAIRLLDGGRGAVDWHCEAPAAETSVEVAGHAPIRGPGYAERLVLTLAPWRLPIDELRWGRWIAADASRSVVWIDWRGARPATWIFVDGVPQPPAEVTEEGVCAGDASLELEARQPLPARSLRDLIGSIAPLRAMVPASLLALREIKWRSAGTLLAAGKPPLSGWAVHELVSFR